MKELKTRAPYYLIVRTDSYTGNFERELAGYVFGYVDDESMSYYPSDPDCYCVEFYDEDNKGISLIREMFKEDYMYEDTREHGWIQFYDATSHPDNEKWNCDSVIFCLQKPLDRIDIVNFDLERFYIERIKKYFKDERIPNKESSNVPGVKAYSTACGAKLISIELKDTRTDKTIKKYEVK